MHRIVNQIISVNNILGSGAQSLSAKPHPRTSGTSAHTPQLEHLAMTKPSKWYENLDLTAYDKPSNFFARYAKQISNIYKLPNESSEVGL